MSFLLLLVAILISIFLLSQFLILLGQTVKNNTIEFYGRSTASFLALFLCACYGTTASAVLNIVGYGGLGQWTTARSFKWCMWVFTGVWFDIEDAQEYLGKTRPAVFVGNHQTELDVLFLGHMFPQYCSVTAKKSLMWVPFLGWFSTSNTTYSIVPHQPRRETSTANVGRSNSGPEQDRLHPTHLPHPSRRRFRCRGTADAHAEAERLHLPRRDAIIC